MTKTTELCLDCPDRGDCQANNCIRLIHDERVNAMTGTTETPIGNILTMADVQAIMEHYNRMRSALQDAITQIEYLHEKFKETGSGNAVLAHCRAVLS